MRIQARIILVIFPENYSLRDAYNIVNKWKNDSINYDIINGKPYLYVSRKNPIHIFVKRLVDNGVIFKTGKELNSFIIPHLSNPPLDDISNRSQKTVHQHIQVSSDCLVCIEKSKLIEEKESEIKELKKIISRRDDRIDKLLEMIPDNFNEYDEEPILSQEELEAKRKLRRAAPVRRRIEKR